MPKLWTETVESHRREVRDAILDATAALVAAHGLRAVTMSQIAEATGIGRATLYKYFPDVGAILMAWHEDHVTKHLDHLTALGNRAASPSGQLEAVLGGYGLIIYELARQHHGADLVALVHQGPHIAQADHRLHMLVLDVLVEGAKAGTVRRDVRPDELASYCLHSLAAAAGLSSKAAVGRLVTVVLSGVR